MAGTPLISHPNNLSYDLLHIPGHRQPQQAPECIHYALWMSINYVANEYPSKRIRDKTTPVKLDTIAQYLEIGDNGWENVGQDPLTQLAAETGSLDLNLEYKYNGHPQSINEFVSDGLDKLLPTIVLVDNVLLERGERGTGPMHAAVVCGVGTDKITIEDPLVEGTTTFRIDKLDEAWDPEFNTAIELNLRGGLQPTRREDL